MVKCFQGIDELKDSCAFCKWFWEAPFENDTGLDYRQLSSHLYLHHKEQALGFSLDVIEEWK